MSGSRENEFNQGVTMEGNKWKMNYLEAAIYLQEGENNDKYNSHPKNSDSLPAYLLAHNTSLYLLDLFASLVLLALAIAERPAIAIFVGFPVAIHSSLELLALIFLGISVAVQIRWRGWKTIIRHNRSLAKGTIWIIMVIEAFVVLVRSSSHFRITRCLRPVFLIDNRYFGGVRRFLRQIMQSIVPICEVLVLLLFALIIFTILGFYMFSKDEKNPYFSTFREAFVSLYVLLTTANYPDVMMPSYARTRWSAAYFILYLGITVFFLMNLLLAIVFTVFSNLEREKYRKLFLHKREACHRAFRLLVTNRHPDRVPFKHFDGFMKHFRPKTSRKIIYLTFRLMNRSNTGFLTFVEFCDFYESLEYRWKSGASYRPYYYNASVPIAAFCNFVRQLIKSRWFYYLVYFNIVLSSSVLLLRTIYISATSDAFYELKATNVQIACIAFFVMEIALKLIGLGTKQFFTCGWNTFDFAIVWLSVCGVIGEQFYHAFYFLGVLRPLRLLRMLKLRKRYKDIIQIFIMLLPTIISAIIVIMIIYYFFAVIGMESFAQYPMKNCCINTTVEQYYKDDNSTFYVDYYYLNNFANLFVSGVTLFELTVVNNWFVIMEGYAAVSGELSRIYFMLFYLVMMVVMSLIMACILEGFTFRMRYNEAVKEFGAENKAKILLNREELEYIYGDVTSVAVLQEYAELSSEQDKVEFIGVPRRTKSVMQRRMFQNIIPQWLREFEGNPVRPTDTFGSMESFSSMGSGHNVIRDSGHPLTDEQVQRMPSPLQNYHDQPMFTSPMQVCNAMQRSVIS